MLHLSDEARKGQQDDEVTVEPKPGEGGAWEHMGEWGGKAAGAVVRIAGILHLCNGQRVNIG
jgi:hypothetical protein